ncbi:hypothetical protein Scep_009498 [Stephania cephalantha]|uniref:Uncharacterized protein n=1 Tax=Stephania cephalantha TaxID=152367 RepID=A0AAP0JVS2_9MAGN
MYDEIIGHENLWRELLGSSYESVKIAVHCLRESSWCIFPIMVDTSRHGTVGSHCIQCGSRQPLAWECLHISTST